MKSSFSVFIRLRVFSYILFLYLFFTPLWAQDSVLSLKIFPQNYTLRIGDEVIEPTGEESGIRNYILPSGPATIIISALDYRPEIFRIFLDRDGLFLEEKLEPFGTRMRYIGTADCGEQPKSVEYFGKENLAVVALLRGRGVQIFDGRSGELVRNIDIPEPYGSKLGFVETVYLEEREEIWVSQMDSRMIHIIDAVKLEYLESVPSGGLWTKILTVSPDGRRIYASNWITEDLGVINTETRELEYNIPLSGIPRGSAFTSDGEYLYVCIYETGNIEKINAEKGTTDSLIQTGPGAARHIVYDNIHNLFYVSDMWHGTVYSLNPRTDRVENRIRVGPNLNTIKLSNDGRYLFVSSRGRNNPRTYLIKGPEFGTVSVIDTESFQIIDRVFGGNQPTGLAVSPDNDTLIFTDFLDMRLEYYDIRAF